MRYMENPICISTGFLYRLTNDRNEMIRGIREFLPSGIELSFARPQYLFDFAISQENLEYLRNLKFNSIHAPWKEIVYGDNQKSKDVLGAIEKLFKQIKARNVVFHKEQIDDIRAVVNRSFIASIENGDWRETSGNSPEKIGRILKENPSLKFTFDFAHALTVSPDDILIYLNKFKDRLISIHLAMLDRILKDHWFLHKYDSEETRMLLNHLKETSVPLVLECVASDNNEVQLIKNEIEYLRRV